MRNKVTGFLLVSWAALGQTLTPPVGNEFTIAWVGDPHHGASSINLPTVSSWLVANKAAWNIKAFVSVGDNICRAQADNVADACMVAVGGFTPLTAFATVLDNASIPYVIINGNHDCNTAAPFHGVWDTVSLPRTHFAWNSVFPAGKTRNQYLKVDSGSIHLGILGITSDNVPGDTDCINPDLTTTYKISAASWSAGVATVTIPKLFGFLTGSTATITGAGAYNASGVTVGTTTATTFQYPLASNPGGSCASNCGTVTTPGTAVRQWAQGLINADPTRQFLTVMHQTPSAIGLQPGLSGTVAGPYVIQAGVNNAMSVTFRYPVNAMSWSAAAGGTATLTVTPYQEIAAGQPLTVVGTGSFTGYSAAATALTASASALTYALASDPGTTCAASCGTVSSAPVPITLTPGTRTAEQVAADIASAVGLLARVQIHPTALSIRIGATSSAGTVILNSVANSAYSTLGLSAFRLDNIGHASWSQYGAYTPCQVEIPDCSRDGVGMWNGFINPNPRILWTLNGHDQTTTSLWSQKNSAGSTIVMPMGGETGTGNILLIKFQPSLHQTTWYYADVTSGAAVLNNPGWFIDPAGTWQRVAVFPWTPILPIPSSAVSGAVTIRGGTVH